MFFRYLLIVLLVYLLYRLFKIFFIFLTSGRKKRDEFTEPPPSSRGRNKIINKDEGEYVDFEEIDDEKP